MKKFKEFEPDKLTRYGIDNRFSKVKKGTFSRLAELNGDDIDFNRLFQLFPDILKGKELKEFITRWQKARAEGREIIFMFGAHVIKCGLTPILIDLMDNGWLTALASNGASVIHDVELSLYGQTSENVDKSIADGSFGMCKDTADFINNALKKGMKEGLGYGMAVAAELVEQKGLNEEISLLANACRKGIPYTIHVALGTDITHPHPSADGAAIGALSLRDFRILTQRITALEGGVVVNFGSMVVLPEVFLKGLTAARNIGAKVDNFTTANFDMIQGYRPNQNVVRRPTLKGGEGYSFTGHHEIMLPLVFLLLNYFSQT